MTRLLYSALILGVALLVFATVAHGQERDIGSRFQEGMEAVASAGRTEGETRNGHLDRAIAAFRSILVDRPELVRVRLELARAFFLKEEDTLARRHFEQVLAGRPPAAGGRQCPVRFLQHHARPAALDGALRRGA